MSKAPSRQTVNASIDLEETSVESIVKVKNKYKKMGWTEFYVTTECLGKWPEDGHKMVMQISRPENDEELAVRVDKYEARKARREKKKNL